VILQIPHFRIFEKIAVGRCRGLLQVFNGQVDSVSVDRETAQELDVIPAQFHSITLEDIFVLAALNGGSRTAQGKTALQSLTVFGITRRK